jgi:long-chain acyl-CoA synthetase
VKIGEAEEILVKGSHVMIEYYKNKEATNCKIDSDGWMHTGDCGHMDENGNLFVRGRIKNDIFVLPSGENVSPMAMESIINSILSGGESIVVLRDEHLVALIYSKGVEFDSKEILSQMNKLLPSHCQLFDVEFLKEPLQRTEKQNIKRYLYN